MWQQLTVIANTYLFSIKLPNNGSVVLRISIATSVLDWILLFIGQYLHSFCGKLKQPFGEQFSFLAMRNQGINQDRIKF